MFEEAMFIWLLYEMCLLLAWTLLVLAVWDYWLVNDKS